MGEEILEFTVDGDGPVNVECNAAEGDQENDDIQDVPELFEVRQAMTLDLNNVDQVLTKFNWC